MRAVIEETGFRGDFPAFLKFLRTDPRFYAKTPEELLKQASFSPRKWMRSCRRCSTPCRVRPTASRRSRSHRAEYTGGVTCAPQPRNRARLLLGKHLRTGKSAALRSRIADAPRSRPGASFANRVEPRAERCSGFRRHSYFSAFGEGWGLYAERLGLEAGFYTDPYSNFGRLTYEMWRACRLVVRYRHACQGLDAATGDGSPGFTYGLVVARGPHRDRSLHLVAGPGAGLQDGGAYDSTAAARSRAGTGTALDVREFHDVVLSAGSVPLPVLEELVTEYIKPSRQRE